ncbi:uncharacterized protein DFL_002317 [Arthrobotrys flagrans]|uniref:Uncharacterized protein n=1 Tax=Arthrobotrys flagrans TaxID=97331 RepID=A0A437AAH4_ARTFL|nr:hypothetical protein DFL_002317 [Arthrobotrys flagrans]
MESRRYRSGHSRSNSANIPDYSTSDRHSHPSQAHATVTPTAQIATNRRGVSQLDNHHGGGGGGGGGHHYHHHHHHHHHHNHRERTREGPTPFFDDDGDNAATDNEAIVRDANGGYGENFEIPHRMLRIIMPELFEHLNEGYGEPHLAEPVNFSSRYSAQENERPRQRLDIETVKALNKQRVASLADDAWMYEAEEDPNLTRHRKQLYHR